VPGLFLYPMTDIGGGIFSLVVTAIFLKFWKPKNEWHCDPTKREVRGEGRGASDPETRPSPLAPRPSPEHKPLTIGNISLAWAPYAIMSVMLMLTGLVRQAEGRGPVRVGPLQTNYLIPIPTLDRQSHREARLHPVRVEHAVAFALASNSTLGALTNVPLAVRVAPTAEKAEFNFAWLTAPGTAVFVAALLSMILLKMNLTQIGRVFRRTCYQMKIPIPTIACMLGLSYVTRYAGMDATLGVAFAGTGLLYPFFAPILGWLGVFLTGTDAGSNALFGSLQKITATEIFNQHSALFSGTKEQLQVLICTSNSTGGVMGKMIDAQSICVATAATNQIGREADIFKAVVWHSIILASVVGIITLLQAYLYPFTGLVPKP
jgi:lactate permease